MGVWDFFRGNRNQQNSAGSLMESFRSENWSKMNADQRLAALQKVENITAGNEGRTVRTVVPEAMEDYGYFSETGSPDCLHINENLLNGSGAEGGYDAIDTLWHEGRHAYQYDAYSGRLLSTANPPNEDTRELWKENFDNNIYRNNGTAYYYQPIEADANRFARNKLKENEGYFAGDPAYEKYKSQVEAEQAYYAESLNNMCGSDYEKQIADEIKHDYQERYGKGEIGSTAEESGSDKMRKGDNFTHSWIEEPLSEKEAGQLWENDPRYADGMPPEKAEDYNETGRYNSAVLDLPEEELERLENEQLLDDDPGDVNEKVLKEDAHYYATGIHRPDWGKDSLGETRETTLQKGTVLDQYSHPDKTGDYFAPKGTPYEKLELNDVSDKRELHRYEVLKDIPVMESKVGQQPWNEGQKYDPETAATQYKSELNAQELVDQGYLREVPVEEEGVAANNEKEKSVEPEAEKSGIQKIENANELEAEGEPEKEKNEEDESEPEGEEAEEGEAKPEGEETGESEPREEGEESAEGEPEREKEAREEKPESEDKEEAEEGEAKPEGEETGESEAKPEGEETGESEPREEGEESAEGEPEQEKEAREEKPESEDKEEAEEGEAKPEGEEAEEGEAKPEGEETGESEPREEGEESAEGEPEREKEALEEKPESEDKEEAEEGEAKPEGEETGEGEAKPEGEETGESEPRRPEKEESEEGESKPKEEAEPEGEDKTGNEAKTQPEPENAGEKAEEPSPDYDYYNGMGY